MVVLLELKVPEATPAGHQLSVSTAQLGRYLRRRLPVFCRSRAGLVLSIRKRPLLDLQRAGGGTDQKIGLVTGLMLCQLPMLPNRYR